MVSSAKDCFSVRSVGRNSYVSWRSNYNRWARNRHERASAEHKPDTSHESPKPSEFPARQSKPESPKPVETSTTIKPHRNSAITLRTYLQPNEPYPDGTLLAGIVWQKGYVDVRLDIDSGAVDVQNLDFIVGLDTSIAGVGQISQFPGVTAFRGGSQPATWLVGTDLQGNPSSVPIVPTPGMASMAPTYRVPGF